MFADVLGASYRHGSLLGRGQVGNPFATATPHPRLAIDEAFDERPGTDTLALTHGDKLQKSQYLAALVASVRDLQLLGNAYAELASEPHRPEREDVEPYTPGIYLDLDPSAKALADGTQATTIESDGSNVAEPKADATIDATVPDFVPENIGRTNGNGSAS